MWHCDMLLLERLREAVAKVRDAEKTMQLCGDNSKSDSEKDAEIVVKHNFSGVTLVI